MLQIAGLVKSYGKHVALSGVDLTVERGEVLALLGSNGAGKTTLACVVAGLRQADAGTVHIAGIDALRHPGKARRHLGLAPQEVGLYPTLSARDNLRFFGRIAGLSGRSLRTRIDEVSGSLGLVDLLDRSAVELSGGQQRRLHTAIALLHRPDLLWLDEPTVGADVQSRRDLLVEVRRTADQGTAVIYATHYLPEAETLNARVAILEAGQIAACGTVAELAAIYATPAIEFVFAGAPPEGLPQAAAVVSTDDIATVVVPVVDPAIELPRLLASIGEQTSRLRSVKIRQPGLEAAYLAVTGERVPAAPMNGHRESQDVAA